MTHSDTASPLLDRLILNQAQRDAVTYDGGPQLVFAGAGTGKTRVLTAKIAFLIEDTGLSPHHILAATFTNKAAREMKERVEDLIGISCAGLWIGTFHSLCARILRRECSHIGYVSSFTIYDQDDQAAVMRKLLKQLSIEERAMTAQSACTAVSHWKNRCQPPREAAAEATSYQQQQAARVYAAYQDALRRQQAMDFDDLLANVVYLFRDNPDVLARYRANFQYVLVDEYQDTNRTQFHLVKLLAGEHRQVFAVGDDDQSIYGWRGAQVENILSFEKEFEDTRTFRLEQNYRSTRAILDFANAAISPNAHRAPKELWTERQGAADVVVTQFSDDRREAETIAREIASLVASGAGARGIMVLFRTNAQSRAFEDAFRKQRIPYVLVGGASFYQRKEIKDCLAYLRLLVNPSDDTSFERILNVPSRGLGLKAREDLRAAASGSMLETVMRPPATNAPAVLSRKGVLELRRIFGELAVLVEQGDAPPNILTEMLTQTGYVSMLEADNSEESEGRIENINELLNALAIWADENPDGTLTGFLEEVSLISDLDSLDNEGEKVSLMTLHSAKGLEADHVFVTGLEDGILPSRLNLEDPRKLEEERRLFYVGITRARDMLHCSFTERRWRFGSVVPMRRSRFLDDIGGELYRFEDQRVSLAAVSAPIARQSQPAQGQRRKEQARDVAFEDYSQEEVQLRMGQHVKHAKYGIGRVLSVSGFSDDMRVTVLFNDGSRKRMVAKFAGLEML